MIKLYAGIEVIQLDTFYYLPISLKSFIMTG